MDDIVWLQSKSSYATISAALALADGRRVALVFPAGERACLHDIALLNALHTRCQLLGKEAVIIGGDAWLRAHAVAAGFEAATTLEDWGETAPELYSPPLRGGDERTPRLWLVAPHLATMADTGVAGDDETWMIEPPDYVIALREAFPDRPSAIHLPAIALSSLSSLTDRASGEPGDDALTASERFEEMVTGRILETSGIPRPASPGAL